MSLLGETAERDNRRIEDHFSMQGYVVAESKDITCLLRNRRYIAANYRFYRVVLTGGSVFYFHFIGCALYAGSIEVALRQQQAHQGYLALVREEERDAGQKQMMRYAETEAKPETVQQSLWNVA